MGKLARIAVGLLIAAGLWWLAKRVWLFREGTQAEPPPTPSIASDRKRVSASPDPVDEAMYESFPASDPPSYAGARGQFSAQGGPGGLL